jgi:dihydroorotase
MSGVLLRAGRLIDPLSGRDEVMDVLIHDGSIAALGARLDPGTAEIVPCDGLVVSPGFIDLHVHLREPGWEGAETVETGSRAAALGGFTAICSMPNTQPVADNAGVVELIAARGREAGLADVFPAGAVSVGRLGNELAEFGAMARSAARVNWFTDDAGPIRSVRIVRMALEYARAFDAVIADHAEESALTEGAQMHEGEVSAALGLQGWPSAAEDMVVARDVMLTELTGGRLHLCHLSTAGSVELVRAAKARGVRVTAEAAPHHFTLTHDAAQSFDPVFKVNPPLREKPDVEAIREGLADGTIDAIATDHAPHAPEHKEVEWDLAPPGMLGLETALALGITELVAPGYLSMPSLVELLTAGPARCRDLPGHGGPLTPGAPANLTVFDPAASWTVDANRLASRARNTPYHGRRLTGRVVHTLLRGAFTVRDGTAVR